MNISTDNKQLLYFFSYLIVQSRNYLQDEKNQIIHTNLWLNMVCGISFISKINVKTFFLIKLTFLFFDIFLITLTFIFF